MSEAHIFFTFCGFGLFFWRDVEETQAGQPENCVYCIWWKDADGRRSSGAESGIHQLFKMPPFKKSIGLTVPFLPFHTSLPDFFHKYVP